MSKFATQHARQEITRPAERKRTFSPSFVALGVIVFLVLLAAVLYPVIMIAVAREKKVAQAIELIQLEAALAQYVKEVGEAPPSLTSSDIKLHVENAKKRAVSATPNFDNFAHDLTTMDERETIVFWLGGEAWQSLFSTQHHDVYFEFQLDRLTDIDNDGWPEYTDGSGNYFILRNDKVFLYDTSTQTEYSVDDLKNKL